MASEKNVIVEIDVYEVQRKAVEINEIGLDIENKFQDLIYYIDDMSNEWFDDCYNEFVKYFESERNNIDLIINYIKNRLPTTLSECARHYYLAAGYKQGKITFEKQRLNWGKFRKYIDNNKNDAIIDDRLDEKREEIHRRLDLIKREEVAKVNEIINEIINKGNEDLGYWKGERAKEFLDRAEEHIEKINVAIDNIIDNMVGMLSAYIDKIKNLKI